MPSSLCNKKGRRSKNITFKAFLSIPCDDARPCGRQQKKVPRAMRGGLREKNGGDLLSR